MKLCKTANAKKMILLTGVSSLFIIAAGAMYYRSFSVFPFALGVFLTTALNVLKIIMIERAVEKVVSMNGKKARSYIGFQYVLRFLLTGAVLALAAIVPFISLWGAVAGVFTLQIAAYSMNFFL